MGIVGAFEAEMIGFILAIEKASEFGWCNLWIEMDSMYIVNMFSNKTGKIPWCFGNRWLRDVYNGKKKKGI